MGQGQQQEPTIAIIDAVAVVPNETDIEHGNSNPQYGTNYYEQTQQVNKHPPRPSTSQSAPSNQHQLVVLHRQQPPQPKIVYGHLGRYECPMQCPYCDTMMTTMTKTNCDAAVTWILVLLLLIIFWPLCWLPLCMPRCKRVHHYCSHCHRKVGITEPCN